MTIQINPPQCKTPGHQRATEALIGVDLTLLSAPHILENYPKLDTGVEYMKFPQLFAACHAAVEGGIDVVSLSSSFFTRSDHTLVTGKNDAVKTVARLLDTLPGGFSAAVPADDEHFDKALDMIVSQHSQGWPTIELESSLQPLSSLASKAERAHERGISVSVTVNLSTTPQNELVRVAEFADAVRLITPDPHEAREARFALRLAAMEYGRDIRVVCEMGVVISSSRQAAHERELLVSTIQGSELFAEKAKVVGTVYDVVQEAEQWFSLGAVDGILFLPASVPTDLASLIRGVIPLMRSRA